MSTQITTEKDDLAMTRVLAFGDSETLRPLLGPLAHPLGLHLEVVESVSTLHSVLSRSTPDLLVLAGERPEQLLRQLSQHKGESRIPILYLSANDDEMQMADILEAGADDCLPPTLPERLIEIRVRRLLQLGELHSQLHRLNNRTQKDQELAKTVFSGAVVADNVALEQIRSLLRPAETFSGDVLLTAYTPTGDLNVLLGDFTGHGLAAAIGALPTSEVFRAMTGKGFSPHQILSGINQKLHALLPTGMYLALQLISIRHKLDYVSLCNCGMPDPLL